MRVITRRATMLAGNRSQGVAEAKLRRSRGAISPASILSETCNHPNCVHRHIFYFSWLQRIYEFLCVHSNPIWKGRNCRDYRPSHLTFREYFRPFWFSRSCVVVGVAYRNWRMHGSIFTLHYIPLHYISITLHCATLNCSVKTSLRTGGT